MKIGLLLPSILTTSAYNNRIFAPRELFVLLANGLVDKGHDVYVYTSSNIKTKAKLIPGNIDLETISLHSVKDVSKKPEAVPEITENRKSIEYGLDLVSRAFHHANENSLDILHIYADFLSYYFDHFTKVPVVYTLHDPIFQTDTFEYWRLKNFAAQPHIAISQSQKKQYDKNMNLNCVATIYHGLNINDFKFSENSESDLLFLGRFLPQKGITDALDAAQKLGIKLSIASSSNYQQTSFYKTQILPAVQKSPALIQEINFLNTFERSQIMGRSKLTLFPIRWEEPFGMVMIESMSCGTPVIAYAQGSTPEVIKDGETGFLVNVSDQDIRGDFVVKQTGIEGICEAIKKTYAMNEEEYKNMRKNCRKHVEKYFTAQTMVTNHIATYTQLIKSFKIKNNG